MPAVIGMPNWAMTVRDAPLQQNALPPPMHGMAELGAAGRRHLGAKVTLTDLGTAIPGPEMIGRIRMPGPHGPDRRIELTEMIG